MVNVKMSKNDIVQELGEVGFEEFVSKGTVLVDFFADWCMPCLMMAPVMDELSQKFKGKIKFAKVNVDSNNSLAQKYKVQSIPNFVLFKDGKPINQFVGAISEEDFEDKLKRTI
jgi:thioredoxin 1